MMHALHMELYVYGSEMWSLKRDNEMAMHWTEMRMIT